jgi:hypothetical protein
MQMQMQMQMCDGHPMTSCARQRLEGGGGTALFDRGRDIFLEPVKHIEKSFRDHIDSRCIRVGVPCTTTNPREVRNGAVKERMSRGRNAYTVEVGNSSNVPCGRHFLHNIDTPELQKWDLPSQPSAPFSTIVVAGWHCVRGGATLSSHIHGAQDGVVHGAHNRYPVWEGGLYSNIGRWRECLTWSNARTPAVNIGSRSVRAVKKGLRWSVGVPSGAYTVPERGSDVHENDDMVV